jgi:hypothetical protein
MRTFAAAIGCLWLLALAGPALAQDSASATAPLSESLQGEARQAYDSAKLLFEDGDPAGALAKFRRAYDLSKEPRLLWNMAVCEKELRHYGSAARLVERYLGEGGTKISEESRQNALNTQQALRSFYSELTLKNLPAGAKVSVDGVNAGTAPLSGPLLVDLGARTIRVELEGREPFEQQIDVPGAEPIAVEVVMGRLQKAGSLSVTAGAKDVITVDGAVVGSGRWLGKVPAGDHEVRVTAPGKKPYVAHVQLGAGSVRTMEVTLEAEGESPIWPWLVGGAGVVLVGAGVGGYFLLKPEDEPGKGPQGKLGTVYLPAIFAR